MSTAAAINTVAPLTFPRRLGKYVLLKQLFESAMSEVYLAYLNEGVGTQRLLVIKTPHTLLRTQEHQDLFRREVQIGVSLTHPNIVQIYEVNEVHSQPYIAMEWIRGKSLRQVLERLTQSESQKPGKLNESLALYILLEASKALYYAHHFQNPLTGQPITIIHRDLSPHNLMLSYDGQIKLIDFGIAKSLATSNDTQTDIFRGKPSYISPEQIQGIKVDTRSDLFSLGTVLYEMFTGKKAFDGDTSFLILEKIKNCDVFLPQIQIPEIPKPIQSLLQQCLQKDPEKRPASIDLIVKKLLPLQNSIDPIENAKKLGQLLRDLFSQDIKQEQQEISLALQKIQDQSETATVIPFPTPAKSLKKPIRFFRGLLNHPLQWLITLIAFALLVSGYFLLKPKNTTPIFPPGFYKVQIKIQPEGGDAPELYLNEQPVELDSQDHLEVPLDKLNSLVISKNLFQTQLKSFYIPQASLKSEPNPTQIIRLEPLQYGTVNIISEPYTDFEITDGLHHWYLSTPAEKIHLPPGTYLVIFKGRLPFTKKIVTLRVRAQGRHIISERLEWW